MRTVNTQLLVNWRNAYGDNADVRLANDCECSVDTVKRILKGHVPRGVTRRRLCDALGQPEDQLFPRLREDVSMTLAPS